MGAFRDGLRQYSAKVEAQTADIFQGIGEEVLRSIQSGSELTGAPGQPVDTGFLWTSWQRWYDSPTAQTVATNVGYAPVIEDSSRASYDPEGIPRPKELPSAGGGSQHIKSTVGGNHSVALTIAGLPRIVDAVTARVVGNG